MQLHALLCTFAANGTNSHGMSRLRGRITVAVNVTVPPSIVCVVVVVAREVMVFAVVVVARAVMMFAVVVVAKAVMVFTVVVGTTCVVVCNNTVVVIWPEVKLFTNQYQFTLLHVG